MSVPIYVYTIIVSLIAAILNWKYLFRAGLQSFIPYLLITLTAELMAVYHMYVLDASNGYIYNIYVIFQTLFFVYLFSGTGLKRSYKMLIRYSGVLYLVICLIVYIAFRSVFEFNRFIFIGSGLLVCIYAICYLFYYFNLDDAEEEFRQKPLLIITAATIFYFSVVSLTIVLYPYLAQMRTAIMGEKLYNIIPRMVSLILYSVFAYAFILCRKHRLN